MADDAPATTAPVEVPAAPAATEATEPASSTPAANEPASTAENGDAAADASSPQPAAADGDAPAAAESTPASGSKDKKRKSVGGVPEHKSKKLNKKKSMPTLHLNCKPGEYYWARLKGYPPWPSIVCDESMLPEMLLGTRPVSTARPDGSIRADFEEGGKNAKERTFPIMFLETNEFQWMVNTSLTPLDPAECAKPPSGKMMKSLRGAYDIAAQNHDLDYYKGVLKEYQIEQENIDREIAEQEAEAARVAEEKAKKAEQDVTVEGGKEKTKKKASRKSKAAADEDVDMEDAEAPKSSKKRKKDADSDAEGPQQKKTPKITKLNAPKTPNGEAASGKKSAAKSKRKVVTAPKEEEEAESKPQLSPAERLAQREKSILYLRHRLQKGFLARDQAPKEAEMPGMADFFTQLESYNALEPSIIRVTKIHKVLKAIIKLASVPKDDEYEFKKRSATMLELWNKRIETEGDAEAEPAAQTKSAEPEANGDDAEAAEPDVKPKDADAALEQKDTEMKDAEETKEGASAAKNADELEEKAEQDDKAGVDIPTEKSGEPNGAQDEADGDVSMQTAAE